MKLATVLFGIVAHASFSQPATQQPNRKVEPVASELPAFAPAPVFDLKEKTDGPLRIEVAKAESIGNTVLEAAYLNGESSLQRKLYILNDATCPVLIDDLSVSHVPGNTWITMARGIMVAKADITAYDLRIVLLDVFGNHVKTLKSVRVRDARKNAVFNLHNPPEWSMRQTDVAEHIASFAFIAAVRTANGNVWRYNPDEVSKAMLKVELKVDPSRLEPIEKITQ